MKMLTVVLLMWAPFTTAETLIGYDCSNIDSAMSTISLTPTDNCAKAENKVKNSTVLAQLIMLSNYEEQDFIICDVVYKIYIQQCGKTFVGRNSVIGKQTYNRPITRSQCELMGQGMYRDPAYDWIKISLYKGEGYFSGFVVGDPDGISCDGGHFIDHQGREFKNVVVHYEVTVRTQTGTGTIKLKEKSFLIMGKFKCHYPSRECVTVEGYVFWDITIASTLCADNAVSVLFEGEVTKRIEILENNITRTTYQLVDERESKQFLVEATADSTICGSPAVMAQSPHIHIIESVTGKFRLKKTAQMSTRSLDMKVFYSMNLAFIYNSIAEELNEMYNQISHSRCVSDHKIALNALYLSRLDAANIGVLLLKKEGIYGRIMGQVAHLIQCEAQRVQLRATKECYNDIPIIYNNKDMYLSPLSKIIKSTGNEITCGGTLTAHFKFNNTWYAKQGENYVIAKNPTEIIISPEKKYSFTRIKGVGEKGIFSSDELERYRESLEEPLMGESAQNSFIRRFHQEAINERFKFAEAIAMEDYATVRSFIIKHILDNIMTKIQAFGNFFACIFGISFIFKIIRLTIVALFNSATVIHTVGCDAVSCCRKRRKNRKTKKAEDNPKVSREGKEDVLNIGTRTITRPQMPTQSEIIEMKERLI